MNNYYNKIWTDEKGNFYLSLYIAEYTPLKEPVVVYYKLEHKDKILITPVLMFDDMFEFHDPYTNEWEGL